MTMTMAMTWHCDFFHIVFKLTCSDETDREQVPCDISTDQQCNYGIYGKCQR